MSDEVRRSAIGVIRREGKLLMLRRYPHDRTYPDPGGKGKLGFPGGKAEGDEWTAKTAEREGEEETGFKVRAVNRIIAERPIVAPTGRRFLVDVHMLAITGGELCSFPSEEHVEAVWLTPAEALERQGELTGPLTLDICKLLLAWDGPHWPLPEVLWDVPQGEDHPGSFAAKRRYDRHPGVDLYAPLGTPVFAMEPGVVVAIDPFFTGGEDCPLGQDGTPVWLQTAAVLVEGAS